MEHDFLDKYARVDGVLQRLDADVKVFSTLVLILIYVLTPLAYWKLFIVYYLLMIPLTLISKVPLKVILKLMLLVSPFILLAAFSALYTRGLNHDGVCFVIILTSKSILSVSSLILLTATTRFTELLKTLKHRGVPNILIMVLSFLYRYIFLLHDELMRVNRARNSRTMKSNTLLNVVQAGSIIGELFIRSFERSERIYAAMVSRGYTGE